jgi:hypothetical protein
VKLTNEQSVTILRTLETTWGRTKTCWVCKNTNWNVLPTLFEVREFVGGDFDPSGVLVPMVGVTCTTCGQIVFFSAIRLGIVPAAEQKAPPVAGTYVRTKDAK